MKVYRWVWRAAWLVIGVVPVGLGFLEASPVALFCLGSAVAVVVAATGQPTRVWFASGLLGTAVVAGLWSAGAVGPGLLVLAFATSPFALARACCFLRRRRRSRHSRHRPTSHRSEVGEVSVVSLLRPDQLAGPVHALEDQQLFRSWSDSFVALKLARTIDERLELVNLRQAYLDELESRDVGAFHSWLRSGARPIGSPRSFFEARGSHPGTRPSPAPEPGTRMQEGQ